jgi:hypothetical protein
MAFSPQQILVTPPDEAPLIMVFSPNGHGKSSFIASAKNPFVIDAERKFKSDKPAAIYRPDTLSDLIEALQYLLNQDKLDNGLIAIDTIDWIERVIHESICETFKVKVINDDHCKALNFNKGYDLAANMFLSDVYPLLDAIRKKHNIPVVIGAQCLPTKQREADKDEYIMQDLRVQEKLAQKISDLMEAKLYLQKKEHIDQKGRVVPTEERYLITRRAKGINAKNNLHLPDEIAISYSNGWNDFVATIGTCKPTN